MQTSVSHSSTESEVISLDAGLRMDGIPALDIWDVAIETLHSSKEHDDKVPRSRAHSEIQSTKPNTKSKRNSNRDVDELINCSMWITLSQAQNLLNSCESRLYIFEDDEVVIKIIIKG